MDRKLTFKYGHETASAQQKRVDVVHIYVIFAV